MPTFSPGFEVGPAASGEAPSDALVVATHELSVVVQNEADGTSVLPTLAALRPHVEERLLYVGRLDDRPVYATSVRLEHAASPPRDLPSPLALLPARARVLLAFDEGTVAAVGQAIAIAEWDLTSRLCGRCGAPTIPSDRERVRTCAACRSAFRPRVSPAVIVLVERGESILLARSPGFPANMYGLIAGFVEPGETLEEAARRETREEVGLELEDLVYAGSQPWPIGRSLMVAFRARHAGGEIVPADGEIEEAAFFTVDALPGLPPKVSIARRLVDAWIATKTRA